MLAAAIGLHLGLAQRGAGPQLDPGAQLLAIAVVWHAEHLHVQDRGWPYRNSSTSRGYTFSPPRMTTSLMRPTMLQKPSASITARSPVCIQRAASITLRGALGVAPVAEHHAVAAGAELARRAARHDPALGVDDLDLDVRVDPPDGATRRSSGSSTELWKLTGLVSVMP